MTIQKIYIQILCLSALFQSLSFGMRTTGIRLSSTPPSSWMAKGFSYGVTPEGQGVSVPQASVKPGAAAQVQEELLAQQKQVKLTPRQRFWNAIRQEQQITQPVIPDIFKDFARKYTEHKRWLSIDVEPEILSFFAPLIHRYDRVYQEFMSNPVDENAQQALIDMSAHMDQFIKYFESNRLLYSQLAALPQDFIDTDQDTAQIRNNGLNGNAKMENVLRNYKFGHKLAAEQKGQKKGGSAQAGMFKGSGIQRMYKSTSPRFMSRQEAANVLGVSENASEQDVKAAYRKAALKAHPDAGGSDAAMQKVNEANAVLIGKARASSADSDSRSTTWQRQDWKDDSKYQQREYPQKEWNEEEWQEEMKKANEDLKKAQERFDKSFKQWGQESKDTSWSSKFASWKRERKRLQEEREREKEQKKWDEMFKNWGQAKQDNSWSSKVSSWFK